MDGLIANISQHRNILELLFFTHQLKRFSIHMFVSGQLFQKLTKNLE